MRYWHVQTILSEYVCPVQLVAAIMGELTATDVFKAKREDIDELEQYAVIVHKVCRAAKLSQIEKIKTNLKRI